MILGLFVALIILGALFALMYHEVRITYKRKE